MKKYSTIFIILITPLFLRAVTEESFKINKFYIKPIPYSNDFEPYLDSPLNAFDGDKKTAAIFSEYTIEFSNPASIDEIKIINGNSSDKNSFNNFNRVRDIEITLYTIHDTESPKKVEEGKKTKNKNDKINIDKEKPLNKEHKGSEKIKDKKSAVIYPVTGSIKKVLSEEPALDLLKQDEPADVKKPTEQKEDLVNDDSIIESIAVPSKDILLNLKKNKADDKKEIKQNKEKFKKAKNKKKKVNKNKKKIDNKKNEVNKTVKDGKDNKKNAEDKINIEPFKKMNGALRIENDNQGRVFIYATLKDTAEQQSISLKNSFGVSKISFRTRDEEAYKGKNSDLTFVSEISFYNKKKLISIEGIGELKKRFIEQYWHNLENSISNEIFSVIDGTTEITRMSFRKDGRVEFRDRYSCRIKGASDCTSSYMPDRWRIDNGKLYMRYKQEWFPWKYELDSRDNLFNDGQNYTPPRWVKLYYKTESGFSDNYLYLQRSDKRDWNWDD